MKIRIKKLNDYAAMPHKAHDTDAGYDLVATSLTFDKDGCAVYGTGLAFEIPEGHVGLLFPRSSNARKDLHLTNSVGVLDSGYRGEVMFKFKPSPLWAGEVARMPSAALGCHLYKVGDRIGQLIVMPIPSVEFVEAEELSDSERGEGGYGSSGR